MNNEYIIQHGWAERDTGATGATKGASRATDLGRDSFFSRLNSLLFLILVCSPPFLINHFYFKSFQKI